MIKTYNDTFVIHTVPLQTFYSNDLDFILEVDDRNLNRKKLTFTNYGALRFTPADAINLLNYVSVDFKEDEFPNVILEDVDSKLIKEFDQKSIKYNMNPFDDDNFYHHYIMFVGDFLIEVIAHKCIVEDILGQC